MYNILNEKMKGEGACFNERLRLFVFPGREIAMRLKDTGLTVQDIKDKVNKYMIETYERFDFLAETAKGMYLYDENGTPSIIMV